MKEIVKTWDISGMGDGYEEACQKMLWTGIQYLSKIDNPERLLQGTHGMKAKAGKGNMLGIQEGETVEFYGICYTPESFKECEDAMMKAVNNDCTGAMYQCVVGHLKFIAKNGLQKWHEELKQGRKDEQALEFDLTTMTIHISDSAMEKKT